MLKFPPGIKLRFLQNNASAVLMDKNKKIYDLVYTQGKGTTVRNLITAREDRPFYSVRWGGGFVNDMVEYLGQESLLYSGE